MYWCIASRGRRRHSNRIVGPDCAATNACAAEPAVELLADRGFDGGLERNPAVAAQQQLNRASGLNLRLSRPTTARPSRQGTQDSEIWPIATNNSDAFAGGLALYSRHGSFNHGNRRDNFRLSRPLDWQVLETTSHRERRQ